MLAPVHGEPDQTAVCLVFGILGVGDRLAAELDNGVWLGARVMRLVSRRAAGVTHHVRSPGCGEGREGVGGESLLVQRIVESGLLLGHRGIVGKRWSCAHSRAFSVRGTGLPAIVLPGDFRVGSPCSAVSVLRGIPGQIRGFLGGVSASVRLFLRHRRDSCVCGDVLCIPPWWSRAALKYAPLAALRRGDALLPCGEKGTPRLGCLTVLVCAAQGALLPGVPAFRVCLSLPCASWLWLSATRLFSCLGAGGLPRLPCFYLRVYAMYTD